MNCNCVMFDNVVKKNGYIFDIKYYLIFLLVRGMLVT